MSNIKNTGIFISTHKPVEVLKNNLFFPIQVGAGIKGRETMEGFLDDSVGENISKKNPAFCELTAQYWAWKNQDLDYYGFFHYRRYLAFNKHFSDRADIYGNIVEKRFSKKLIDKYDWTEEKMLEEIESCDIIVPEAKDITKMPKMGKNLREQYSFSSGLHAEDLDIMLDVLKEKYPSFVPYAKKYLDGKMTRLNNMFIMKKAIFNEYCEWLFDILFECDKRINYSDYSVEATRTPGHLAERLFNIYMFYLEDNFDYNIKEFPTVFFMDTEPLPELKPAFKTKNIAVALSSDDYYVPYVATVLASIKDSSSTEYNYDILIMHKNITDQHKEKLVSIVKSKNFSLRFVNISCFEEELKDLFCRGHFTIETWFRLLMPELMPDYQKVLYLDSDLVVKDDVAKLYNTNVESYLLAACHDADTAGLYNGFESNKKNYMDNILKIKEPYNYFQAGVILFNLNEFRKKFTTKELLDYASSMDFELLDQDVLNSLAEGRVKFVDMSWNVMFDWNYIRKDEIIKLGPKRLYEDYLIARENAKIIHYAGPDKPWTNPDSDFADIFWNYARKSGFYEVILNRMFNNRVRKDTAKDVARKAYYRLFKLDSDADVAIKKALSKIKR